MYLYDWNCFWHECFCFVLNTTENIHWPGRGVVQCVECGVFREASKVQVESPRCALWSQVSVGRMCGSLWRRRGWAGLPGGPGAAQPTAWGVAAATSPPRGSLISWDILRFTKAGRGILEWRPLGPGCWRLLFWTYSWKGEMSSGPKAVLSWDPLRSGIMFTGGFAVPFCSTTLDLKTTIEMERFSVVACC